MISKVDNYLHDNTEDEKDKQHGKNNHKCEKNLHLLHEHNGNISILHNNLSSIYNHFEFQFSL